MKVRVVFWFALLVCVMALPMVVLAGDTVLRTVTATLETPPMFDDEAGGFASADEPAIWVHPSNSGASLVFGTAKEAGLFVYNLNAQQLQKITPPPAPGPDDAVGRWNNVDVMYNITVGGKKIDIAVVSDRGYDKLRFFKIDPAAAAAGRPALTDITAANVPWIFSKNQGEVNDEATAYGLTTAKRPSDKKPFAFVTQAARANNAMIEIIPTADGRLTYAVRWMITVPSTFTLPNHASWTPCMSSDGEQPQSEGLVVDSVFGLLYISQEQVGIYRMNPWQDGSKPVMVDKVRSFGVPYDRVWDTEEEEFACTYRFDKDPGFGGKYLTDNVEGVAIYYADDDDGYLLISSQGDNTYVLYERAKKADSDLNKFVGHFKVVGPQSVDALEDTDGIEVINVPLGSRFPKGLMVIHDGVNKPDVLDPAGEPRDNGNFKFVPWQNIANAFPDHLKIEPDKWKPR